MRLTFNDNSKSIGRRGGVDGNEIADTLEAVFAYFEATKQDHPKLLEAIRNEARGWRGKVDSLRGADQEAIDSFFGQPAPKDVAAVLKEKGITPENTTERDYDGKYDEVCSGMQKDANAYWPGCVVPTLDDYQEILRFDAYREQLDGIAGGPAATLARRIDAFDGGRGRKHGAATGLMQETSAYISNTPRHPSETYVAPDNVGIDYVNAFNHSFSHHIDWKPTSDMRHVTARVGWGAGVAPGKKYGFLAHEKAKFDGAFARAGIDGDVSVQLGKTYGEDAIRVVMSMEDYTGKYLPVIRGEMEIDTSVPGSSFNGHILTSPDYRGYEPGKKAFFYGDNVMIEAGALEKLALDAADAQTARAAEALRFLRETNSLSESAEKFTVAPGQKADFVLLARGAPHADRVFAFEDTYYSSSDLHNKITDALREIEAAANGRPHKSILSPHKESDDTICFEYKGNMYIPRGEKYYQAALFMEHKYGIDYTWVLDDKAKEKADGREKFVIRTSLLAPDIRAAAMADLRRKLDEDYVQARLTRRATVLQRAIRVKKPLRLAPKA